MSTFILTLVKDGAAKVHDYKPTTEKEANGVGNELVRDKVADFFRVDKKVSEETKALLKKYKMRAFSCGFCEFEGLVSETPDHTRCPNCGSL